MKFHFNSPLMDFLNTTAQYIALNILFIICCLPIITIGPSVAALYQVIMREARGEYGYLIRKFFKHFKEMFVQSFLTSVLSDVVIFILLFNIVFWNALGTMLSSIILVLLYILLLITVCTVIYVFPLMARFQNGFRQTIKNAFLIAMMNPKSTLILLLLHALAFIIPYYFRPALIFLLMIGFSFLFYCNSYILQKVFKRYEAEENTPSDQ